MRMRPPSMRFFASALLTLAATVCAGPGWAQQRVGVNAAVNTNAEGTPPGAVTRKLVIGQDVVHNEDIKTDAGGQTQILFLDGSSVSVGPNSDLLIDDFVYDPATGTGKMTLTAVQGAMRFVGGKLSKQPNAVTLHIGTATIGVRGGVFVADVQPGGKAEVIFIYGQAVTVSGQSGCSQSLYRSGFAVDINGSGGCPDSPHEAPPGATVAILSQLDGRTGSNGGATTVPTNATVANSGIPNTVSNNVVASIQQAVQNTPTVAALPPPTVAPPQIPTSQVQVASSQTQPVVVSPTPPTPPQPVVIQIAGLVKVAPVGSTLGFTDQSATARIPYTGSITYQAASGLQNGVVTGADATGTVFTLSPLTAGTTTTVTGTASTANNPATGTAFESADGDFFYANLTGTGSGQQLFAFGGTPVAQTFFAPQPSQQFYAFNVQPDASLGLNGQAQTIPFLSGAFGGTMSNAVVSPFYVATSANEQFGVSNNVTHNDGLAPKWLQASFAVNGQNTGQTSALIINMGSFSTSSDNGQVIVGGLGRGTVSLGATSPVVGIFDSTHSVPDANGNSLFGGSTIDGFVLDQNDNNITGNFVQNLATAAQFGQTNVNFAFNQPVTNAGTFTPTARSALNETGFFGGIMSSTTNPTSGSPYALIGTTVVATDPVSNRVQATFAGTDPFTSAQSGINSMVLQFGSLPSTSTSAYGRSVFIDNSIYAAAESPVTPSSINGQNLPTYTTVANPTTNAPGAQPPGSSLPNLTPSLAMVTVGTLGPNANSWFPAGVTACSCQYLQWGYWTGQVLTPNATLTASTRDDRASINTWIAGQPTVTMPTSGTGNFNGAAVGTVFNNGATYLAAGSFNNTYNFGSNTGTVSITNFDLQNFAGTVSGSGSTYTGSLAGGGNKTGAVVGQFYGPAAAETGGVFGLHSTSGAAYLASGIFAGAR